MAYLNPARLSLLADTTISAPSLSQVLTYNGTSWINQAIPSSTFTLSDGLNTYNISGGDTVTWQSGLSPNHVFDFDFSTPHTNVLKWAFEPTTGGSNHQVLIFNDSNDTYLWGDPIVIASGSSSYLSYNSTNRELSVSNLLITDVTVDNTQVSIAAYVGTGPTHQEGDIVILTAATGGSQTWIHNGGTAGTAADYTQILDGAAMSSFTVAGTTGSNQTITNGNTLTLSGVNGIGTVGVATDTIQIKLGGILTENTTIANSTFNFNMTATTGNMQFTSTGAGFIAFQAPTGGVRIGGGATPTELRFYEASGAGTNYVALKATNMAANTSYTLPSAFPTVSGQVLSSNTSGVMSWITASGGGGTFDISDGTTTQTITVGTDTITFNNGLNVSATDTVKLGGALTGSTTITQNNFDFNFNSIGGGFKVNSSGAATHQLTSTGGTITISNTTGAVTISSTTGNVTVGPTTTGDLILDGTRLNKQGTEKAYINSRTTTYTLVPGADSYVYFSAAGAAATINLPAAPTVGDTYHIKCTDVTNTATLNGNGSNIDGAATFTYNLNNQAVTVVYNGTQWLIY